MPTKAKKEKNIPKTPIDKSNEKLTLAAIKGSAGIISSIARRLDIDWHTAESWIQKYPSTLAAFAAEREGILDMAEATIYTAIKQGDTGSAKWILSTIGRKRGFNEKQELEVSGGISVTLSALDAKL